MQQKYNESSDFLRGQSLRLHRSVWYAHNNNLICDNDILAPYSTSVTNTYNHIGLNLHTTPGSRQNQVHTQLKQIWGLACRIVVEQFGPQELY